MNVRTSIVIVLLGLLGFSAWSAETGAPLRVLVVTGGHGFKREPFFQIFKDNAEISFVEARHVKDADAYERGDLLNHDVVVLYDMPKTITERQKSAFLSLFERGVGVVVLHHALVSFQHWPEYERIIGGRYPEEDGKGGVVTKQVGYEHDVKVPVVIAAREHPITAGLSDFTLHDEIYWGYRVGADVTPLLTTTHAKSGKTLGWTRTEGKSRVVYLQSGHGPEAFENPNYRKLVAQSIRWASGKESEAGWLAIFDGKTLDGWVQRGGTAKYRVEEGAIVGTSVANTPNSFLCTERDFTNFVLKLEFKVDPGLNSGVQVRSHAFDHPIEYDWRGKKIKVPAKRVHGLQVEIDPSSRAWSAGIHEEGGRSWLNDLKNNEPARQAFRAGEWNALRIECRGNSYKTWINDVPAADLKDERVSSGFIGLQVHGVGRNPKMLEVRFRKLLLKEL